MPITYDIESDYLYKLGMQKAREKELVERQRLIEQEREQAKREREKLEEQAKRERENTKREREQAIENLLKMDIKPQQIVQAMNVSMYLVKKVKKRMES